MILTQLVRYNIMWDYQTFPLQIRLSNSLFPLSLKSERDDEALIHFWKEGEKRELGRCQKYSVNGTVVQGASVASISACYAMKHVRISFFL